MTFRQALTTWLKARSQYATLLYDAGLLDYRVYPLRKPQGVGFPQLCWWQSGGTKFLALDGPVGITTARVQFDCRGLTLADAESVAAPLLQAYASGGLNGFRGDMSGVFVQAFLVAETSRDDEDAPVHGEEAGTALVSLEAAITYEDPT